MLTSEIKRKIDSARDILVGKIPDPKAQVEQITTALIYKFMDDMDKEAVELGGKARFFTDKFEKYAWTKLMDPKLGGIDRLNLYVEAISQLNQNPNIPQLFRDIFKDAFLPYRSPETLNLFLKEINGFRYEHSEDLGDAYEYLLSVLGSQGDAGQFRTPRHIINFIVSVVDPTKDDKVLDPACGTAGFLISAYKNIERKHDGKDDVYGFPTDKEAPLTPDERKTLINNFVGYDISPDMVRISKVNMYLHGFPSPTIHEYDTLSSDDRWDEMYDVILANPPFMSPKGGIKPHRRFPIPANRSEVLFVSYILEHLKVNGRAGIIVPEGIIFQSGNAYKQLRKMLVEDGLLAVVSLPPGVFNPYSGVKTCILIFDEGLSKKTKDILFLKMENDGFGLGAQRRPTAKNDLPQALEIIKRYKKYLSENREFKLLDQDLQIAHLVLKEKISESGEYDLTGDRYKEVLISINQKWPMVELADNEYFNIESGGTPDSKNMQYWDGNVAWATLVDLPAENHITEIYDTRRKISDAGLKNSSAKLLPEGSILVSSRATIGRIAISKIKIATNQGFKNVVIKDFNKVNPRFVAYMLTQLVGQMINMASGGTFKEISKSNFSRLKIPLPLLEVQNEIVAELDRCQRIIDGARQVIASWKPIIVIDPEWKKMKLSDACEITSSKRIFQHEYVKSGVPFYRTKEIVELNQGKEVSLELFISNERYCEIKEKFGIPVKNDILISAVGTIGISWIVSDDRQFYFKDGNLLWLRKFNNVDANFIKVILDNYVTNNFHLLTNGAAYNALTIIKLKNFKVPIPPLEMQKQIVSQIKKEQYLVDTNKELIEVYEQKIKSKIAEVWNG